MKASSFTITVPPFSSASTLVFSAAGFIATSTFGWSPGVRMSREAKWIWNAETPCERAGGGADLGREVGQRGEVVAEHRRGIGEAAARPAACRRPSRPRSGRRLGPSSRRSFASSLPGRFPMLSIRGNSRPARPNPWNPKVAVAHRARSVARSTTLRRPKMKLSVPKESPPRGAQGCARAGGREEAGAEAATRSWSSLARARAPTSRIPPSRRRAPRSARRLLRRGRRQGRARPTPRRSGGCAAARS